MSDFVRFTKNGLVAFDWDGGKKEYVSGTKGSNVGNLRSRCEIESGVTLGDIFEAVQADLILMEAIANYSWCGSIEEFHEQAKLPPPQEEENDETLVEIVIESYVELHSDRKDSNKPLRFEGVWPNFGGISKNGQHYSLSLTPMNELAHLPVRITNTCEFRKDFETLFTSPTEYTFSLLEVLDAIYWDISFYGSPKETVEFRKHLLEMKEEVDSGKAKLIPFEDVFKDEDENQQLSNPEKMDGGTS